MTTKDLLREYLDQERNCVFSYSANYLMDTPKRGYEREFAEACERVDLLESMLEKLEGDSH